MGERIQLSIRLDVETARKFKVACAVEDTTGQAVLEKFIQSYIQQIDERVRKNGL